MKSIKEYAEKVVEGAVYVIMAAPFILGMEAPMYKAYASGFVRNYNQAIVRNADIDGDGKITHNEELRFKQTLLSEIAGLGEQGRDLDEIVDWLKTR